MRPLAIDLFTGLHGWAEGLIAAGFYVVGFDLEDMSATLGEPKPDHFSLVVQDVLTLHGAQFRDAELIVASPPCQFFSYTAMPWTKAKERAARTRADPVLLEKELALFRACFRIQREASAAAGRHIPMVVENVRGAIPWVGRSRWNFGSYHLWGDLPALMPPTKNFGPGEAIKRTGRTMCFPEGSANPAAVSGRTGRLHWQDEGFKVQSFRFDGSGRSFQTASVEGMKAPAKGWFNDSDDPDRMAMKSSKSPARKAASAKIAKIPFALANWIGKAWYPRERTGGGGRIDEHRSRGLKYAGGAV